MVGLINGYGPLFKQLLPEQMLPVTHDRVPFRADCWMERIWYTNIENCNPHDRKCQDTTSPFEL
jgi:hypothetical protein